jgi:hypothetical protein
LNGDFRKRADATTVVMTPRVRKFALTAHVTSSVGWLGAVASFLALAIAGLLGNDDQMVRSAYLATELTTWIVAVPLAFASLVTGLIVALGTSWGLFRHYWVLVKFMLTILATVLLLLHTQPIEHLAAVAREGAVSGANVRGLQIQLVGDAGAALLALLVNVTLSVYKPQGLTQYGRRKQAEQRQAGEAALPIKGDRSPWWIRGLAILVVALILVFVVLHLAGGGLGTLHHR